MISKDQNLIIIGPPGAGKGTQAEFIASEFTKKHIIAGDILREFAKEKTPLGEKINAIIDSGKLVDDDIVNQSIEKIVKKTPENEGILLDGYPRSLYQAEFIDNLIRDLGRKPFILINLIVSEEEVMKRLGSRKVCENCKKLYHPPKSLTLSTCTECGGKLVVRDDDNPKSIGQRLREYKKEVTKVIDHYRNLGKIIDIDGEPSIKKVSHEIEEKLNANG